ncbi:MAG: hypothetical protein ACI9G1_005290, partial [Pirellulaceae bacterium]
TNDVEEIVLWKSRGVQQNAKGNSPKKGKGKKKKKQQ